MPCEECDAEWAIIPFFLILTECFRVVVEKLVGLLGIAVNFLDLDVGEGKEKLVFFALSRKVGRQFYLLASACLYHTALMCPSHGWIGWDSSAIAVRHPRLWSFLCFLFPVWFMRPLDSLQHPRILIVRAIFVTPLSLSPIEWSFGGGTFLFLRGPSIDSSPLVHVDASLGLGPRTRTVPRHVDPDPYPRGPPPGSFLRSVSFGCRQTRHRMGSRCRVVQPGNRLEKGVARGDEAPRLGISDPRDRVAPTPPRGKGTNRTDRMCTG